MLVISHCILYAALAVTGGLLGDRATAFRAHSVQEQPVSYANYQLYRAYPQTTTQLKIVYQLARDAQDVQVWATYNNSVTDFSCAPEVLQVVRRVLRAYNIPHTILIHDLQEAISNSNPAISPEDQEWENRSGHRLTWRRYHRYKDIESYLDYLGNTYPDICQVEIIGYTSEGREIKLLRVTTGGPPKPAIWIDGGIHGREWISPSAVTYLLLQLVEFREEHPLLLGAIDWYVLPVANPDGYEYSHTNDRLWRKTRSKSDGTECVGVDVNRNFDFNWLQAGSSDDPCEDNYAGTRPFSEPETEAMADFLTSHPDIAVYLSFNSDSQLWLVPAGYTTEQPDDYYDTYVAHRTNRATENLEAEELIYTSSGGSDDWAKGVAGIKYTYTISLPDTGRHGFVLPASSIEPIGQETWEAVKRLAWQFTSHFPPIHG